MGLILTRENEIFIINLHFIYFDNLGLYFLTNPYQKLKTISYIHLINIRTIQAGEAERNYFIIKSLTKTMTVVLEKYY